MIAHNALKSSRKYSHRCKSHYSAKKAEKYVSHLETHEDCNSADNDHHTPEKPKQKNSRYTDSANRVRSHKKKGEAPSKTDTKKNKKVTGTKSRSKKKK